MAVVAFALSANAQKFQQHLEAYGGPALDKLSKYSVGAQYGMGCSFTNRFFIGAGAGFRFTQALYYESPYGDSWDGKSLIPIFGRARVNLLPGSVSPFLSLDLGTTIDVGQNENKNTEGLFYAPSVGISISTGESAALNLSVGINVQHAHHQNFYEYPDVEEQGSTVTYIATIGMSF